MSNDEQIKQLQMMEQTMQNYLAQKQQLQTQLVELNSAISELNDGTDSYQIIGSIMVKKSASKLKSELQDKKEVVELKIKSVEKQENNLREKTKDLQQEVMANMKGE